MATKAAHTAFNRSVAAYLQSIGAELLQKGLFKWQWKLNTVADELLLSMYEPERSEVFSLFCQFTQPAKAAEILRGEGLNKLNHYSGKWNFHSYDAKELLEEFKEQIAPLLINTLTT